jgi:hypothetical protein
MYGDDAWKALCWVLGIVALLALVGCVAIARWVFW